MKQYLMLAGLMFLGWTAMAQDPTIGAPNVSPSPGKVNGPVTLSSIFKNQSNTATLNNDPNAPTVLTFSLVKVKPTVDANGVPLVTGAGSVFFTWTAECVANCSNADPTDDNWVVRGIQNQDIPGKPNFQTTIGGEISIPGTIIAASTPADVANNRGNGYNINIAPSAGQDIDNSAESNSQRIYGYTDGVLPVTLTTFTVKKEGSQAQLSWGTTSETNSDRFEIQHSTSGKSWQQIGVVKSHGESKALIDYTYSDIKPVNGENLYRLKMVDKDATFTYSRIQSVTFEGLASSAVNIYPNPSSDKLFIQDTDLAQVKQVSIMDMNGRAVFSSNTVNSNGINVSKFNSGTYILHITNIDGSVSNHKIVIAK